MRFDKLLMSSGRAAGLFLLLSMLCSPVLNSHPMAPSLWSMQQLPSGEFQLLWKSPLKGIPGVKPKPLLPESCRPVSGVETLQEGSGRSVRWKVACDFIKPQGQHFAVTGLAGSPVGVLFSLSLNNGNRYQQMLSAEQPMLVIPAELSSWGVFSNYTAMGTDHLLDGIDHLLLVIVLTLLVGWGSKLLWTVTFFTLGHSLTLALTVLGYVHFPPMLVEALIALSIAVACVGLIRRDRARFFQRWPWLFAGLFGLLHGMGFAGALAEVGLPAGDIPLALLGFNLGIEIGQLLIVAVVLGVVVLLKSLQPVWPRYCQLIPVYVIGSVAAMWFWQRLGLEWLLA